MTLSEWVSLDEYWQEAVYHAVSEMVEAQKRESKKSTDEILHKIQDAQGSAPYVSPMASLPKPTFQMS